MSARAMPDVYVSIETAEQAMLADYRGAGARSLSLGPMRHDSQEDT